MARERTTVSGQLAPESVDLALSPRVLIVVPTGPGAQRMLAQLEFDGLDADWAGTARRAADKLAYARTDLVIVDTADAEGRRAMEAVANLELDIPILALGFERGISTHGSIDGQITGLPVPFGIHELRDSVLAILQHGLIGWPGPARAVDVGSLVIDPARRQALLSMPTGETVDARLSRRELHLLWYLARRAGTTVSRVEMHERVWAMAYEGRARRVDAAIKGLRTRLHGRNGFTYVQNVFGMGYRFEAIADPGPQCDPGTARPS